MKNFLKLIGVVLVATFLLVTCKEEEFAKKGGTIEVYNSTATPSWVNIYKGSLELWNDIQDSVKEGDGTLIPANGSQSFTKDEDGIYLITAIPPVGFRDTATLLMGNTSKVTIKN